MIKAISQENFNEEIKEGIVAVDFWATWCAPCKMLGTVLEEVASELEGKVKFAKVNVDENANITSEYKITNIPTVLIFKNSELVDEIHGFNTKVTITDLVNKYL
ncbi:thioredoxin [Clostridium sp. SHJSY1]|uniref:thioredoxin n=1 Tax=Clostridium sp. SHJSY1 TaxID=2942483 RepID=UPI00287704CE|nr:thioredoxin [Clostridium sp. SHJSY1]MDS0527176.1 thioredoxin [Clostridium sp. SHJSY1]